MRGRFENARVLGAGHIHTTFVSSYREGSRSVRYVHQRINRSVFPDPLAVMGNVSRVLSHLRSKLADASGAEPPRRVLTLVPAKDGLDWWVDGDGEVWRTYLFIDGAAALERMETPRQAFALAKAFGTFERLLADLPGPRLAETIPGFHDAPGRLAAFRRALEADDANRAREARPEVEFALAHADLADALVRLRDRGLVRERVAHNDTKLDNVLFDEATGEAVCVIDLDTVMPGLSLFDFGDMVRSAVGTVPEDAGPRAMTVRAEIFAALAAGFAAGLGGLLTSAEHENLVLASEVMTFECGLRFLTDFLDGDRYFQIRRPGHNLDRCRTQFALLRSLLDRERELRRTVEALPPTPEPD